MTSVFVLIIAGARAAASSPALAQTDIRHDIHMFQPKNKTSLRNHGQQRAAKFERVACPVSAVMVVSVVSAVSGVTTAHPRTTASARLC